MKIAVMGAGGVGCYCGGMLARTGHDVVLIGRPVHVEAIVRAGLLLESGDSRQYVPVQASITADAVRDAELVLCCVKSSDIEIAADTLAPWLAPQAMVLSLQNGVDSAARLGARLGRTVLPTGVYVATEMAGPGHVRHRGGVGLKIGPSPPTDKIVALFGAAGVHVEVCADITGALWEKLALNCAYNALSAITGLPYGPMIRCEGVEALMHEAVNECVAVARADGVFLPDDLWPRVRVLADQMPAQRSSTAQDLARGKRSEIDHLNGYVVRRGAALGVATPVNRVLLTLVKALESHPAPGAGR
jgi:2-dehydropantoate 2-reductase